MVLDWEIYPYDGDTYRYSMNEVDDLIKRIDEILEGKDKRTNHEY